MLIKNFANEFIPFVGRKTASYEEERTISFAETNDYVVAKHVTVDNKKSFVFGTVDLALGITMLVVGILAVTSTTNFLNLSAAAQWALIGAGGAYTAANIGPSVISGVRHPVSTCRRSPRRTRMFK